MSGVMTSADWSKYAAAVDAYSDSVSNQTIIWKKQVSNIDRYGEGGNDTFQSINLLGLVSYNSFRTWPVDKSTTAGTIDKEYCHVYLNKTYLSDNGYLTSNGLFEFSPEFDEFIINGLTYTSSGDTDVAQANTNPLFVIIILQRKLTSTGTNTRP